MNWVEKLKERWGLKTLKQVIIVLVVFACTGFTVLFIKAPILDLIRGDAEKQWWMSVIYFILILPIYNILLLGYGFIFGQFDFFWNYEKKSFQRLANLGKKRKKTKA